MRLRMPSATAWPEASNWVVPATAPWPGLGDYADDGRSATGQTRWSRASPDARTPIHAPGGPGASLGTTLAGCTKPLRRKTWHWADPSWSEDSCHRHPHTPAAWQALSSLTEQSDKHSQFWA